MGFTAFGLIFGLSALAAHDVAAQVLMVLFGLLCALCGPASEIVRLTCDRSGLRYRTLWTTVEVPASQVTGVTVRSVPGYGKPGVRIDVDREAAVPLKLATLQRLDNPKNRVKSDGDAEAIRRALGLPELAPDRGSGLASGAVSASTETGTGRAPT